MSANVGGCCGLGRVTAAPRGWPQPGRERLGSDTVEREQAAGECCGVAPHPDFAALAICRSASHVYGRGGLYGPHVVAGRTDVLPFVSKGSGLFRGR